MECAILKHTLRFFLRGTGAAFCTLEGRRINRMYPGSLQTQIEKHTAECAQT